MHTNKQSIISQRNVGTDAPTAIDAVHGALRHDPDIIFIGEMRDPDTIRAAIDAASTGHLVISTFHANTAAEVINRIVSFFDPVERDLVRLQLRDCIRCVLCQRLVPKRGGGRVPALEFLFADTNNILECILNGNTGALRVAMQQTTSESTIMEHSLMNLVREGLVLEPSRRPVCVEPGPLRANPSGHLCRALGGNHAPPPRKLNRSCPIVITTTETREFLKPPREASKHNPHEKHKGKTHRFDSLRGRSRHNKAGVGWRESSIEKSAGHATALNFRHLTLAASRLISCLAMVCSIFYEQADFSQPLGTPSSIG